MTEVKERDGVKFMIGNIKNFTSQNLTPTLYS